MNPFQTKMSFLPWHHNAASMLTNNIFGKRFFFCVLTSCCAFSPCLVQRCIRSYGHLCLKLGTLAETELTFDCRRRLVLPTPSQYNEPTLRQLADQGALSQTTASLIETGTLLQQEILATWQVFDPWVRWERGQFESSPGGMWKSGIQKVPQTTIPK